MKVFLITWGLFCLLIIVGLFIASATNQLPGAPTPQAVYVQILTEDECSPCEENLKRLTEAMERAGIDLHASINTENMAHQQKTPKQTFEEFLRAFVVYNRNRNPENLAHLEQMAEEFQKVFDLKFHLEL